MLLCIFDLFFSALDIPFSPRSDDRHGRSEVLDGKFESYLIVSLSCASMDNGIRLFLEGYFHKSLCNTWSCCTCSKKILFINGTCLHCRDDVVIYIVVDKIQCIELCCTCLYGLFLQALKLIGLSYITCYGNDFRIVVVLLQPRDDD